MTLPALLTLLAVLVVLVGEAALLGEVIRLTSSLREMEQRVTRLEQLRTTWIPALPGVQRQEWPRVSVQRATR